MADVIEIPDLNNPANDPQEVIINPVAPPPINDFIELNDLVQEVEENIPLVQQIQNLDQAIMEVDENIQQLANAFPIPQINVLGEEIPFDQLMGENNNGMEEGGDDFDPDLLEVPGENALPDPQPG